jgi:SAM-dependent methyltransferase
MRLFWMVQNTKGFIKSILPKEVRRKVRNILLWPPRGLFLGRTLKRLKPLNREFGFPRGLPIDRYYIEKFLKKNSGDIQGKVLEVADRCYTVKFGGERVTKSDVLNVAEDNPETTIVADLTQGDQIPTDSFDCVILTQTLQFIYDVHAAMQTIYRILNPGGILLATFPGISQISRYDMDRWGEYWRFTTLSACRLLETYFPPSTITVASFGNVLATVAFLQGMAAEDLGRKLDYNDPDYELIITAKAVKPGRGT